MRTWFVWRPAYRMGLALLLTVTAFAALRSQGVSLALGREAPPSPAEEEPAWRDAGETLWQESCAGCHAELAHVPDVFAAEGGRGYLLDLMLYGANGPIEVDGDTRTLRHRPYGDAFDDAEHAALLNTMLVSWGNAERLPEDVALYDADDVAAARGRDLAPEAVVEARPTP